ncbi:MAG: TRAP transporter large permease [Syntrophaceae bacterium]|nr:TRAP transporter large permease [Syntrophaceae bacterium]
MDPLLIGLIGFIALIAVLAAGLHIAFGMALVGTIGLLLTTGPRVTLGTLSLIPLSTVFSYSLVVIPLFILMGNFAFVAGITRDLYDTGYKWFGRLPGGLAMATVFACAGFAAATGSSVAMVGAMSKMALPEMDRFKYHRSLSLGSIAGSGTLGVLIPPSIVAVIYGVVTEQSVGKILVGSIFPGILTATLFMVMIGIRATINPALGPRAKGITWRDSLRSLKGVWGILVLFITVMGSIYTGIATATEAGALGCLGSFIIAFCLGKLNWGTIKNSLLDTVQMTAMIFAITIGAAIFCLFLTRVGFAGAFMSLFTGLQVPTIFLVIIFLLIYIPLGMFFDAMSMILLTLPIIFPVLQSLGVDGIWFGVMVIIMIEISLLTPPVGLNVYVLKSAIPDVDIIEAFKSVIWFIIVELVVVGLMLAFPQIVLFLPNMMK